MNFLYVDQVNQNLVCSICCFPFQEPVTISCQHTFCLSCLNSHLNASEGTAACPLCKCTIGIYWTRSKIVTLMVDELKVLCENKSNGCIWQGERQLYQTHLGNCGFAFKYCSSRGCDYKGLDLSLHYRECPHAEEECSNCGMKFKKRDEHERTCSDNQIFCSVCQTNIPAQKIRCHGDECPSVTISCSMESFGCDWMGQRNSLELHLRSCSLNAIKSFLTIYENDKKLLMDENLALKNTVKTLESRVVDLTYQLESGAPMPNSISNDDMNIPVMMMENLARDFAMLKAEAGQSGFRRDLEIFKLRDEFTQLRSYYQALQLQLFNLVLKKRASSQSAENPMTNTQNSTKL